MQRTRHRYRPTTGRQAALGLLLVLLSVAGCTPGSQAGMMPVATQNGPLKPVDQMEWGMRRLPPGMLQDAGIIVLHNTSPVPVTLDQVYFVPDRNASPLRLAAAFVTLDSAEQIVAAGHWRSPLLPFRHFRVPPISKDGQSPLLVLRVGPALPRQVHGQKFTRNNDVNLLYHTPDGTHYLVAYPVRIEYPN